jgi:hypothetical protein
MRIIAIVTALLLLLLSYPDARAETVEERINKLEQVIQKQEEILKSQQKVLEALKEQTKLTKSVETKEIASPPPRDYRLDDRAKGIYLDTSSPIVPYQVTKQTSPSLMNPAISLTLNTFYYESNLSEEQLILRGRTGYGQILPFDKGFNLESAELAFFAPVDSYFNLYATVPVTEDGVELEEAYFVTTSLPAGLQVKGGKFKSGFGRFNAFHPHAWDFVDAPLNYNFFLGEEGLIEKGVQMTYLPDLPFYLVLGAEALQGDNTILFGPEAASGPHAFTGFAKSSVDFLQNHTLLFGGSVVTGKTKTDSFKEDTEFSGDSTLYGLELTYKWKPSRSNSLTVQSEYLYRPQKGELTDNIASVTDPLQRYQDGLYIQALYQWERWRFGARYDRMGIFKDEVVLAGTDLEYGQKPYRYTGSVEFNPTEFSRLRLQYNYDHTARDGETNNEIFLQLILAIGAHGAHPF